MLYSGQNFGISKFAKNVTPNFSSYMGCGGSKSTRAAPITKHFVPLSDREGQSSSVITLAESLGLTKSDLDSLWVVFQGFDQDGGGLISLDEFIVGAQLEICESFARLCFRIFDNDGSGTINFEEFVTSVWGLCTCDTALLSRFSFDLFDLDGNGSLSGSEVAFMASLLHDFNPSKNVKVALHHFEEKMLADSVSEISCQDFMDEVHKGEVLLMPATEMELLLMKKSLGIPRWQKLQNARIKNWGQQSLFQILGVNEQEEKLMKCRGLGQVHPPGSKKIGESMKVKLDKAKELRQLELKRMKNSTKRNDSDAHKDERHARDIKRVAGIDHKAGDHAHAHAKAHVDPSRDHSAPAPGAKKTSKISLAGAPAHSHDPHQHHHAPQDDDDRDEDDRDIKEREKPKGTHGHGKGHGHSHSHGHHHGHSVHPSH